MFQMNSKEKNKLIKKLDMDEMNDYQKLRKLLDIFLQDNLEEIFEQNKISMEDWGRYGIIAVEYMFELMHDISERYYVDKPSYIKKTYKKDNYYLFRECSPNNAHCVGTCAQEE